MQNRQEFEMGTWLDPEEKAYPSGSITAGRKAKALCPDGKVRTFQVGIPDTFFTIPARGKAFGRSVTGYVGTDRVKCWNPESEKNEEVEVLKFTASPKYKRWFEEEI